MKDNYSEYREKLERLKEILKSYKKVAVAFSGGVDSSLVARAAYESLGKNAIAVTVNSPLISALRLKMAKKVANSIGIKHKIVFVDPLEIEPFRKNVPDRCYFCKKAVLGEIKKNIEEDYVLVDGTNTDDDFDFRPGQKALQEEGIRHPLKEAGLGKKDIRFLSKKLGLTNWNEPSDSCLAARIKYGNPISKEKLKKIEKTEEILKDIGLTLVRARLDEDKALRIEVIEEEIDLVFRERNFLVNKFKDMGFRYITVDLEGYIPSGSRERE
ncbi:MAG: ATP-dependent sacrificial sulfur transferase LarE [Actinomycetia bacterium]|nr:ATP-dependent sacrificial sulfur transferase LarE [Actinomycetes bacterium]